MLKKALFIFCFLACGCTFKTPIISCAAGIPIPGYAIRNHSYAESDGKVVDKKEHMFMVNISGKCY